MNSIAATTADPSVGLPARVPAKGTYLPQVYILKIASRCNLDCKYCYMYNLADQTWRQQPRKMSEEVLGALARKVARSGVPTTILFHGGEPTLVGMDYIRRAVQIFREACGGQDEQVQFAMQTNGTLLNEKWIDLFHELGIGVGISLDGPPEVNDENRVYRGSGRGSHDAVARAIKLMLGSEKGRAVFGGALCVVNLSHDPLRTYRHFVSLGLTRMSFLPMDGNYLHPPPGKEAPFTGTPLADWLIPIFDDWFLNSRGTVTITLFDQIIKLLFGLQDGYLDLLSTYPKALGVIETDGGIEPTDSLKSVGDGFTKVGLNVVRNEIEEMFSKELIQLLQSGEKGLAARCRECRYKYVCGGGLLAHRYAPENGFDNPTIYCSDMMKLISHIEQRVAEQLSPALLQRIQAVVSGAAAGESGRSEQVAN